MVDNKPKLDTIEAQEAYEKLFTPIGELEGAPSVYTSETNRPSVYAEIESIRSAPYSNWETFINSGKLMWEDTTLGVWQRHRELRDARKVTDEATNPLLTPKEAMSQYGKYGVVFNNPIRKNEAEVIASRKIRENALRQRLSQTEGNFMSGASSLLGSFAGSMLDPINIATAFIPVTKLIPALKGLETAGVAGRIALKSIDGMIMNSLVEPLPLWMASIDQRDYDMADSLFNIVAGGVFGAGLGTIAEGLRVLSPGEKFNANMAASIDFANNRGLDNVREFQNRRKPITAIDYDSMVTLPTDKLHIAKNGSNVFVRLRDEGDLSGVVGKGKTFEEAKLDLRKNLTGIIGDDSIYKGYRLDDGIEAMFAALRNSGDITTFKWAPKWIEKLEKRAIKAGMSLEDFLAKQTNNFTDFSKVIKAGKEAQLKQAKYSSFYDDAFDDISSEALDDLIERGADEINAMAKLKDALNRNPRVGMDSDTILGNLREQIYNQKELYNDYLRMSDNALRMQTELENLKKQLDVALDTTERENLMRQISDLEASINSNELAITNFLNKNDIDTWRYNADNVALLEDIKARLAKDPRNFGDVTEQLTQQLEKNEKWDTNIKDSSDGIVPKDSAVEVEIDTRIKQLEQDTLTDIATLKEAIANKELSKDTLKNLDIDSDGYTSEMRKADKVIEQVDQFNKDIESFVECRKTEIG